MIASPRACRAGAAAILAALTACRNQAPAPLSTWIEPATGMVFVYLPPGQFQMGSPAGESGRREDELLHKVSLTRGFWMGRFEVTQGEWARVMGPGEPHPEKPSPFRQGDPRFPVVSLSYGDAQRFLARLEALDPGYRFRLPTEAEWEYACRAGTGSAYATGDRLTGAEADFDGRDPRTGQGPWLGHPAPVGSYRPNPWGLFDLHGNAWEWTSDWYGPYPAGPVTDPAGPAAGREKVIRGGSWAFDAGNARSACRGTHAPGDWGYSVGFRVVCDQGPAESP
ncbi:MAG TPA: formylglycine-generating enzyme family protein [Holophagaceae bacterium]|nr:formylglycine-generating enzyme family protein [Holophagaceae bacterium]